jgi:hypothetical protein
VVVREWVMSFRRVVNAVVFGCETRGLSGLMFCTGETRGKSEKGVVSETIIWQIVWDTTVPDRGNGVEDGVLVVDVVELGQFAVFAVAAMPR